MKKTKILLSCAMMLMFCVSVFANQPQKDVPDCMIPPQDNENEIFFMFFDMPQEREPMFNGKKEEHMKQFEGRDNKDLRKDFFKKNFEDLNLTDKQKEDIQSLKKSTLETNLKLMKEFREKTKQINDELLNENYNLKNIKSLNKELNEISSKVINNSIENKKSLRTILTYEQYNKIFKPKTKYDFLAKKLNLSNEQKEKVTDILENSDKKVKELKDNKFEKKNLLKQELEKDNYSKDNIENLIKEISNISSEILQVRTNTQIELKSILTVEQYNKLNDIHRKDNVKMHKIK